MSLCANSSVLGPSMAFGYSGVALTPLMSPTSDVKINKVQANWIGQYYLDNFDEFNSINLFNTVIFNKANERKFLKQLRNYLLVFHLIFLELIKYTFGYSLVVIYG